MAEIPVSKLKDLTGGDAGSLCRVLALPSVAQGGQVLPVYPKTDAVTAIFGVNNTIMGAKNERELLAYWAVTGALSTTMLAGKVATNWMQKQGINQRDADAYARALYSEVYQLLGNGFPQGMEHVSTPGGLNEQMLRKLRNNGVGEEIEQGLEDINTRITKHSS
jgi:pyrroline-5-carboxylate reductase